MQITHVYGFRENKYMKIGILSKMVIFQIFMHIIQQKMFFQQKKVLES